MKSNGEATGQREITTLVQNQYVVATREKINRELDVTCTSIGDMEDICWSLPQTSRGPILWSKNCIDVPLR